MFRKLIEKIQKEIDDSGELKSINSLYESMRLDMLSVVKIVESKKFLFFKTERYLPTMFKLQELLEGTETVDVGGFQKHNIGSLDFTKEGGGSAGINLVVPNIVEGKLKGEGHMEQSVTEIKLESVSVSPQELHEIFLKSKLNEHHLLVHEMEKNKKIRGLGVVYEVMKNENPVALVKATGGEGSAGFSVTEAVTGEMDASAKLKSKQRLKLDAGCVLGFKVHPVPLNIEGKESDYAGRREPDSLRALPKNREEVARDFPRLKSYVEGELQNFGQMDRGVKKLIWDPLSKSLKCPEALYALDCMLEEGSDSIGSYYLQEVPEDVKLSVQDLLQVTRLDSVESSAPQGLLKPIGFLVGALSELDEEAVTLILDLGDEDRGQTLKLVEGVLEQVCSTDGGVPPGSGELSANTMEKAIQILTSCGLKLSKDCLDPSLGSPGAPDEALLALYISLKGVDMLLGP